MPSVGAITKTIRLNAEDREYIESLMGEESLTWSGAIHKVISERGTPQGKDYTVGGSKKQGGNGEGTPHRQDLMDRAVERDIGSMCRASNISTHDFYRGVCELFNEGQIGIEEGKVKSYGEYDLRDFEMVCYKLRERPDKMLEKLTRSLERNV